MNVCAAVSETNLSMNPNDRRRTENNNQCTFQGFFGEANRLRGNQEYVISVTLACIKMKKKTCLHEGSSEDTRMHENEKFQGKRINEVRNAT